MNEKTMIAMSGGVDSAVVAYLIKQTGCEALAATVRIGRLCGTDAGNECASDRDVADARELARKLGIEHFSLDLTEKFEKEVVADFVNTYISGGTPNPCVECNKHIKFGELLDFAEKKGASRLATGHYADIRRAPDGRFLLCRPADETKDQTYVLWKLGQEQLSRIIFPLAKYRKDEVRALAEELGFAAAHRRESQDICFIPDGDYAAFIERASQKSFPPGNFIDISGNILGRHSGIIHYTIGQRKGLGIALGEPMYVGAKSAADNSVTLCRDSELFTSRVSAHGINLIACDRLDSPVRAEAKIRYRHKEAPATVTQTSPDELMIEFDEPQRAPSPGQSVVIYDGEVVIGGGIIA